MLPRDEASKAYADATRAVMAQQWQQAYELYLKAWQLAPPNGQALMQAGLMAARMGKKDEAQRLYDQAVEESETVTGERVAVDTTDVPSGAVQTVAWSATRSRSRTGGTCRSSTLRSCGNG